MVETDVTAGQRHASEFQGRSGHPPCSRMIEDVTIEDVTEEFWIGFCRTTESVEHPHRPYVNVAGEKYSRCHKCAKFLEKQRLGPSGSISMIVIPELAPRWIDNDMIDSPAMFSAYMEWAGSPQGQGHRPLLTMIIHHSPMDVTAPSAAIRINDRTMPQVWCNEVPCARCEQGRGGYKFRWFAPEWSDTYDRIKRPGARSSLEILAAVEQAARDNVAGKEAAGEPGEG